jgi:hypothetical protein
VEGERGHSRVFIHGCAIVVKALLLARWAGITAEHINKEWMKGTEDDKNPRDI